MPDANKSPRQRVATAGLKCLHASELLKEAAAELDTLQLQESAELAVFLRQIRLMQNVTGEIAKSCGLAVSRLVVLN